MKRYFCLMTMAWLMVLTGITAQEVNPDATCFSETNLLYMKNFYRLYQPYLQISPQLVEQFTQQAVEQFHGVAK